LILLKCALIARVVVLLLTMPLCLTVASASADVRTLTGAVHDPKGDAYADPTSGEHPDVKRVSVSYDPAAGAIEWRIAMWSPAPSFFMLKAVSASVDCSPSSPTVFYLERAAAFPLRIAGVGPAQHVAYERVIDGTHLTETWSGPELQGLDLGCIRGPYEGSPGGEVTTGIINVGSDTFAPFAVRWSGRHGDSADR
jgi:hypothetical protein